MYVGAQVGTLPLIYFATPETFFTPSHGILYLGVGINVISAIFSVTPLIKKIPGTKKN